MTLHKAVKDVLDEDGFIGTNTDGSLVESLRTAYAEPYVPFTDRELMDIFDTADNSRDGRRAVQAAVLARLGIEVKS